MYKMLFVIFCLFLLNPVCFAESYKILTETKTHTGTAFRGKYTLKVKYPVISNLKNKKIQDLINKSIESYIPSENSLVSQQYEITYSSEKYLSILLKQIVRNDLEGAAHGMPGLAGLVYDLRTGKQVTIDDLFKPDSDYKEHINKLVKQRIEEINYSFRAEFPGISKEENFYLTEENLILCYPPYLYTCFANSPLKIEIPLKDLKHMLKINIKKRALSLPADS